MKASKRSLVQSVYLDSELGTPTDLNSAGTALENPYVYDSAAKDLKAMAAQGLVKIVEEQRQPGPGPSLISRITFSRLK